MDNNQRIADNIQSVKKRIIKACQRSGHKPQLVQMVAVTKNVDQKEMQSATSAGLTEFGESRVQEFLGKKKAFPTVNWHFVGHLQRNKVRYLAGQLQLLHSMDRWSLAEELSRIAVNKDCVFKVLVQVNVAQEPQKKGLKVADVAPFLQELAGLKGISVEGLMTIAPYAANPEQVRPVFREMKDLLEKAREATSLQLPHLSMGMSNDYEVAVEEGANLLRIGTAIFGTRCIK